MAATYREDGILEGCFYASQLNEEDLEEGIENPLLLQEYGDDRLEAMVDPNEGGIKRNSIDFAEGFVLGYCYFAKNKGIFVPDGRKTQLWWLPGEGRFIQNEQV